MRSTPDRPRYEHRQIGWVTMIAAFVPLVWAAVELHQASWHGRATPAAALPGLLLVVLSVVVNFTSLKIVVTTERLVVRFGYGPFRKIVPLESIAATTVVKTRWYEGWGIHRTRRGWRYNVAGFDAVELQLVGGKTLVIGSDDAVRLQGAIDRLRIEREAAVRAR